MMEQNHSESNYLEKILKNYSELKGDLHLVELEREAGDACLGLSLVGSRDLATMGIFVVGIQPASVAASSRLIHIGDELLEINGLVLFGRSHLNASAIIKSISCVNVRIILIRSEDFPERMAMSPLRLPPVTYKDSTVTLIPRRTTPLSLGDVPNPHDPKRTPDVLPRQPASSKSSQNSNGDLELDLSKDETSTINTNDYICSSQQKIDFMAPAGCRHFTALVSAAPVALETESTPAPVCRPLAGDLVQNKGRRLQKSPQVEETDEEVTTATSTSGTAEQEVAPEYTGSSSRGSQLQTEKAKPLDVMTTSTDMERNHHRQFDEASPETSTNSSSSPLHPLGSTALQNPSTCSIISGRSNIIEVRKGKLGIGLKIIGGSDTILKAIVVYEIFKNGAAAKDGRLRPGDQILEVNGQDLRDSTHGRAVQILRQVAVTVKMVVFRDESVYRDDELYEAMTVELMKKPGKGLGLSIVSSRDDTGILISDIVKGGCADADGRLLPGDQILAVNGDDMRTATQDYAAELLKTSMGKIILQVGRMKVASKQNSSRNSSSRGVVKSESNASDFKHTGRRNPKIKRIGCHDVIPCLQLRG